MVRASVRWVGLLLSLIASITLLTSLFSPAPFITAQDVASEWRATFRDNAGRKGIDEKIIKYAPNVYNKVQSWWSRLFPDSAELRGLEPEVEVIDENARCRIYTYYAKSTNSNAEDTEALLQVWLKAWWAAGLYPVILTDEASLKHSEYTSLHKKYTNTGVNLERIDAVLAMDVNNYEGMLTANHVFPMAPADDAMLKQMRQCQVLDVMTKYRSSRDDIMRGSSMAYKILVKSLVAYNSVVDEKRVGVLGMEGVPGVNFRELDDTKTFAVYDSESVQKLYPKLYEGKPVGKGGQSFRFTKSQLASLVNGHLQDNFLINHRGGIEALIPDLGAAKLDYISRASLRVAMELTRCNLTPLPKSCAPQHTSANTKCFDCSQLISSAIIRPVTTCVPKNNTFFIGNIPHPLTLLALEKERVDLSAADVRNSVQDSWLKQVTTATLRKYSGALQGLIFLSNSLWQYEDNHLPNAQLWYTFETGNYVDLEYEVGFSVPELKASLDQIAQTTKEKSKKFQEVVRKLKSIVTERSDTEPPKALELVESWSHFDTSAHQLVHNYVEYKAARLARMKAENRNAFVILPLD